ncbi:hypothetical protein INT47_011523 [Mucor saturninus]|uniref:Uncharacterized protein n=1 Tax=Mucor saturninus TaxID=64648 RepID=A0A8H7QMQ4_9FUNG|nr:hypothetical protein INT47_011523 [Mucor saturninus]
MVVPSSSKSSSTSAPLQEVRQSMNAASASRISKFPAKPEVFRGDASNPMVWLHSMERIYNGTVRPPSIRHFFENIGRIFENNWSRF